MADLDAYVTLAEFKAWKRSGLSDLVGVDFDESSGDDLTEDEQLMVLALNAARERIDAICRRSFNVVDLEESSPAEVEPRTFWTGHTYGLLFVDDFVGSCDVTLDGAGVRFAIAPHEPNRPAMMLRGGFRPHKAYEVTPDAWGWPSLPESVRLANLMLGLHEYERRLSAFGIQGQADTGFIRVAGADRDIAELLEDYVRLRKRLGR